MRALLLSDIARCPTLPGVYLDGSGAALPFMATTDGDTSITPGGAKISLHQLKQEIQLAWV